MAMRDKIEHAIQNQPCTVKDLKSKFGGDRGSDRKVMEAVDQLVHEAVICQRQGVFFTVRSGRADKALLCKVVKLGKNFAFVMLEDGTSDIFIPGRFTRGAMPGDMVLVEKFEHPRVEGSDEGEILAILEEKNDLVGTARRIEGRLKFVPDDCPAISMQMMRDCEGGAKDGAEGTQFACFLDELVDIEVDYTYKYMEVIGCESVRSGQVTEDLIHIVTTAYFNGMFEPVRHRMDKARALHYVRQLNRYHMAGFETIFHPENFR